MTSNFKFAFVLVASTTLTVNAFAQNVNLKFTGTQLSNTVTGKISVFGDSESVFIGGLKFTDGKNTLFTYCADPSSLLNSKYNTYNKQTLNVSDPTGLGLAGKIMVANHREGMSNLEQAGLQLAIWSAVVDNGSSFNANGKNFKVSGVDNKVLNFASQFYTNGLGFDSAATLDYYKTSAKGGQSQLQAVPEPATLAAISLGAVALMGRRRKKNS